MLGVGQGNGFMLLANTRPDGEGRYFATRWFMLLFPLVPLGRYHVRQLGQHDTGGVASVGTTTEYQLLGRSRLRLVEVLRTYLMFWVVMPVMFVGPIVLGVVLDDDANGEFMPALGAGVSIVMLGVFLAGFNVWRVRLRPVRHACE